MGALGAWEGCVRPQRPAVRVPVSDEKEGGGCGEQGGDTEALQPG